MCNKCVTPTILSAPANSSCDLGIVNNSSPDRDMVSAKTGQSRGRVSRRVIQTELWN